MAYEIWVFARSVLNVFQELLIERFGLLFGQLAGVDQHAEAEGRFLSRLQRVIQRRRAFGEFFRAEGIRREEAVAARVPVSRIGRILRVIEDGDHHILIAVRAFDAAGQRHPFGARAPGVLLADFAFAAQVDARDAGVVHQGDFGRIALLVGEDFRLGGRLFELARDADAERAFFRIVEDDLLVLRGERDDAVNDADVFRGAEDNRLVLP